MSFFAFNKILRLNKTEILVCLQEILNNDDTNPIIRHNNKMDLKQIDEVEQLVNQRQATICDALETIDTESFKTDSWHRPGGGGAARKADGLR